MSLESFIPYLGYTASLLIALSMVMSNIKKLRIINLFGASTFAIYGLVMEIYPVLILNLFIVTVDIVYLYRIIYTRTFFNINDSFKGDEVFVKRFLTYYESEICELFPHFSLDIIENPHIVLISRELVPVGLFVYEFQENGDINIHLDFACPEYRDFKNAHYLFEEKRGYLMREGHDTLVSRTDVEKHQKYLRRIGFQPVPDDPTLFKRQLVRSEI